MTWPPVAADMYTHAAPSGYFTGVSGGDITKALLAAYGELATALGPRCGGDPASWTWEHAAGKETATRDVCRVAAADLTETHGLSLPSIGEGGDVTWVRRAASIREMWTRMGTVGKRPAAPLYAGLVDATPDTTEGAARGWYTPFDEQVGGIEA